MPVAPPGAARGCADGKDNDRDGQTDFPADHGCDIADDWTESSDVEATKPDPDLVEAALEKAGTREGVMIGDSTWDVEAAKQAGIDTIAVITGGFAESELREAGAAQVFESVAELLERLGETALG